MKNYIAFMLLLVSIHGYSQKKGKVDPKDVTIDSLTSINTILGTALDSTTKVATSLSTDLDSVTKELTIYKGMYTTIKDQVVMHDFDPSAIGTIIDSLKTSREASISGLTSSSQTLADSLSVLNKENAALKEMMALLEAEEGNKEKLVAELKQLKDLLDAKIITQEEFDEKKELLMAKW